MAICLCTPDHYVEHFIPECDCEDLCSFSFQFIPKVFSRVGVRALGSLWSLLCVQSYGHAVLKDRAS